MSRRSSNAVKLARLGSHHPLDRNGIPILDDPATNRLPKRCPSEAAHSYSRVALRFLRFDSLDRSVFVVEFRCVACGARATETEVEG